MNKYGSRAGNVDVGEDKRVPGNLHDYFDVCQIVENSGMTQSHGNKFLQVISRISRRHGNQCPLPSEYRTLKDTVLKKVKYRTLPISKMMLKFPKEMFGDYVDYMKPMAFVYVDIAMIIAEKLLTIDSGNPCFYVVSIIFTRKLCNYVYSTMLCSI